MDAGMSGNSVLCSFRVGSSNCSIEFDAGRFMMETLQVVFVCHEQTSDIALVHTWLASGQEG